MWFSEGRFECLKIGTKILIDRRDVELYERRLPDWPFVQWEPSDLEWMEPLGMAPEKEIDFEVMDRIGRELEDRVFQHVYQGILK